MLKSEVLNFLSFFFPMYLNALTDTETPFVSFCFVLFSSDLCLFDNAV